MWHHVAYVAGAIFFACWSISNNTTRSPPNFLYCVLASFSVFFFRLSLNPLSAIWRIYPSSKWSSQWPYDGYIRHGLMTSCGCGRDSATLECFGQGSQGTIFVRRSKISLFFRELCSFRRVFVSRVFVRFGAKRSSAGAFGFDDVLELFLKLRSVTVHLFANSDYELEYFLKITFLFSK